MRFFTYGNREIEYLKAKDKILGDYIEEIGFIEREVIKDPYKALIHSFISQQISLKAAETVWARLIDKIGDITVDRLNCLSEEEIKSLGMTYRKAGYIKSLTEKVANNDFDLSIVKELNDDELIKYLTSLKGVGVWTAEMLMIFSLERMNVLSYDDLAIRRGLMNLYGLDSLDKKIFAKYKDIFSPYSSVASLYIWERSRDKQI